MATGQALFVAGDIMWNWYETIGESPFPSLADVLYLAGYPFIAFGLLLLIKRRIGDGDRGGLLDAAILTTAVAILSWTFFIRPQTIDTELDPLSLAISLAYPVADLLLIGVAMGLLTTPGARTPAFRMLGLSLVALLVADQIYAFQNLDESYVAGGAARQRLPHRLHPVRDGRRASVDAAADRPGPGRGHLARPGPDDLPRRGDGHRPAAGHDRPGRGRRPRRHRRRDRAPVAARAGPPLRPGAASWPATSPSAGPSSRSSATRPSTTR